LDHKVVVVLGRASDGGFGPACVVDCSHAWLGGCDQLRMQMRSEHQSRLHLVYRPVHYFVDTLRQRSLGTDLLQLWSLGAEWPLPCEVCRAREVGWALAVHFVVMNVHFQDLLHFKVVFCFALV